MYLSLHFDSHEMKLVHENISLVNNVKKVIFDLENDSAHWFQKCFLFRSAPSWNSSWSTLGREPHPTRPSLCPTSSAKISKASPPQKIQPAHLPRSWTNKILPHWWTRKDLPTTPTYPRSGHQRIYCCCYFVHFIYSITAMVLLKEHATLHGITEHCKSRFLCVA